MSAGVAMSRILKFLLFLVIVIIGLAVHLRNDQSVIFDYYLGSVESAFSLFLILAMCAGAILGILAGLPLILKLRRENSRLASRARLYEKELDNLRVIPVRDNY